MLDEGGVDQPLGALKEEECAHFYEDVAGSATATLRGGFAIVRLGMQQLNAGDLSSLHLPCLTTLVHQTGFFVWLTPAVVAFLTCVQLSLNPANERFTLLLKKKLAERQSTIDMLAGRLVLAQAEVAECQVVKEDLTDEVDSLTDEVDILTDELDGSSERLRAALECVDGLKVQLKASQDRSEKLLAKALAESRNVQQLKAAVAGFQATETKLRDGLIKVKAHLQVEKSKSKSGKVSSRAHTHTH
jgi:hypothetical protein